MELNKQEISVLEKATDEAAAQGICELEELQLAMIGGGIGETVL